MLMLKREFVKLALSLRLLAIKFNKTRDHNQFTKSYKSTGQKILSQENHHFNTTLKAFNYKTILTHDRIMSQGKIPP